MANRKRTRRLWGEEGHKRPAQARKRRRLGEQRGDRIEAARPDQVWALDFQYDVTSDGRQLRFLNIVDEFTREAFATRAARSFTADATVAVLEGVIAETGRWRVELTRLSRTHHGRGNSMRRAGGGQLLQDTQLTVPHAWLAH